MRQSERNRILSEKEARQRYIEERIQEVEDRNTELIERIEQLRSVLPQTLTLDDTISFESLRIQEEFPAFKPPSTLTSTIRPPEVEPFLAAVKFPNWFQRLFPSTEAKHQAALAEAKEKYQTACDRHKAVEAQRKAQLASLNTEYEKDKTDFLLKVELRNSEVDQFKNKYYADEVPAIIAYNTMVLERSQYPDGFPQVLRVAFAPESKELVIEYEVPTPDIVPRVLEYKYVKVRDAIEEKPRKQSEIKDLYQDLVAGTALRTIHEVFEADQGQHLVVVTLNEFVQTVDPTTGRDVRPCLVSVRVTRDRFDELDLSRIDKRSCLRNLGAQVSPRPDERIAVKPLIEFDMVHKRFVDGADVIGELESRPKLDRPDAF